MRAEWGSPEEIRQVFAQVSILKDSRVVFNIKGNQYRLVVKINYPKQWVFIRFIGTPADYDKIDANTI
jgi:mRNA interferase HigB